MMTLEKLAKKSFDELAKRYKTRANWSFLSIERRLVWMREIVAFTKVILDNLRESMKPVPPGRVGQASYERGYNDGVRAERLKLSDLIQNFDLQLENELKEFISREEEKRK